MRHVVVLIASHNRRELTTRALGQLASQKPVDVVLSAVLVDCGSTDGTREACAALGDWVNIVPASSDCFWAEAMSIAEQVAQGMSPDLLLWVNDDVCFEQDALPRLLECYDSMVVNSRDVVVVGSMRDASRQVSYGGVLFRNRISRWEHVEPSEIPLAAEAANGNFLVCSSDLAHRIGGIDGTFGHSFADFDWSLRAVRAGASLIVAPGFFGVCNRNSLHGTYRDPTLNPKEQWKHIRSMKGLPMKANAKFLSRHGGVLWPVIWSKPYASILLRMVRDKR